MSYPIPANVKQAARDKYAWPGGYPLFIIMNDGGALCIDCVRAEWRNVARSTVNGDNDGWRAAAADINWEDAFLHCDHCGGRIESAYAED